MTYPDRWTTKIPAGRPWRSPDGTTCCWRVHGDEYRIQTSDRGRAGRLDKMTRIEQVGHGVAYPLWIYRLDGAKMNTKAVRNLLRIDPVRGANLPSKASEAAP